MIFEIHVSTKLAPTALTAVPIPVKTPPATALAPKKIVVQNNPATGNKNDAPIKPTPKNIQKEIIKEKGHDVIGEDTHHKEGIVKNLAQDKL